jgi:hypothetical protein
LKKKKKESQIHYAKEQLRHAITVYNSYKRQFELPGIGIFVFVFIRRWWKEELISTCRFSGANPDRPDDFT